MKHSLQAGVSQEKRTHNYYIHISSQREKCSKTEITNADGRAVKPALTASVTLQQGEGTKNMEHAAEEQFLYL